MQSIQKGYGSISAPVTSSDQLPTTVMVVTPVTNDDSVDGTNFTITFLRDSSWLHQTLSYARNFDPHILKSYEANTGTVSHEI
jgi:hypothetical protein